MNLFYDLHIHSALSPCGDEDMTPNNIINMSLLKKLDVIAVTDHNTALNLKVINNLAKKAGILLVPGMELETSEEIHVLCYFETIDAICEFEKELIKYRPKIKNRIDIFGHQYIFDKNDQIIEDVPDLISIAHSISIEKLPNLVNAFGGIAIPAHVDKSSYSIISNLGTVPAEYNFGTIEISRKPSALKFVKKLGLHNTHNIIKNSDAHYLYDIMERMNYLSVCEKSTKNVINILKSFTS